MSRIIIAEDDDIVSELLQLKFMEAGHAVGVLDNGTDALAVINAKRPDLVILDCNMPGMSGVQVVQQMRKSDDLWNIPVLMLTARRGDTDISAAMYAGADEYATKPFDPDEIVFRAENLIESFQNDPRDRRA
ncbi:response regulator transcription factor [Stakelama sp. CBK3Z-3]|uniref:Response regulator transcription factor n=1 Tax=Stakelama flava TaxID=2860338 RepID=A0ABS6XHV6_9SPHN|nr:response regulator transcription factor [Stakelama flava]MBW4329757.1 response regulator transcription factor [Stakelama flava]